MPFTQSYRIPLAAFAAISLAPLLQAQPVGQQPEDIKQGRLEQVIVTATREARARNELPESVGVLSAADLEQIMSSHPAEALNRMAGVHVNNLGGEGHMTSIRQPLTTGGVYLFLEDGIPTRPTGFFNHNGLYEIDLTQADRIEVTRGPGSALYGSDAIGGMINSLTRVPGAEREIGLTLETGENGWYRGLLSASGAISAQGRAGVQVNVTDNRGFRDDSDYSRASVTARWDQDWTDSLSSRTVFSWSTIDQSGVSALDEENYRHNPEKNLYQGDIGFREVNALRLSSELAFEPGDDRLWTLTIFARDNRMDLMPAWMLSYDPNLATTEFHTLGLMAKHRRTFAHLQLEWISGLDMDYTPASYQEHRILLDKNGPILTGYRKSGRVNYDINAEQLTLSPYTQLEWRPLPWLRLSAGVRYDHFRIDYRDNLDANIPEVGIFAPQPFPSRHFRPDDQQVNFQQWSPKLGLVMDIGEHHNAYATWRHAFRAPTAGQLFRSGSVPDTTDLKPVTTISREVGLRGRLTQWLDYDLALYHMTIEDDIVSLIIDNTRKTLNSGETRHQGAELTLLAHWSDHWSSSLAFSHSQQEYKDFSYICGTATCNYAGNDIPRAPDNMANATLAYAGADNLWRVELEWEYLGSYYTDETNTRDYDGHELLNLRGQYRLSDTVELYARLQNLTDRRYSTYTSNQVGAPDLEYRPGQPRTGTVGVRLKF